MKTINASYYIRGRDKLDTVPEEELRLYGTEDMCTCMQELCLYLSLLAPQRLIELRALHYAPADLPIEIYFAGEEICIDDCGTYYKFDEDDTQYVLKDGPGGLYWERIDNYIN